MKILYIVLLLLFSSFTYSQSPCPGLDSLNYGNQWYHTVQIGSQCWLKENLNVGTMKPAVKDQINNDTIEKFCYNNDPSMCDIYGGLYQWREAVQYTFNSNPRGICPIGWHLPSMSEFDTLILAVGRNGNSLKNIGQGGGTNSSGFSALLSGKFIAQTSFNNLANETDLWSSNHYQDSKSRILTGQAIIIEGQTSKIDRVVIQNYVENGMSVRCVMDNNEILLLSPNGGEFWQVGTEHKITWGGYNLSAKFIKIEYTRNSGTNWISIADSVPAKNGNYIWTIPISPSNNCRVRITDINNQTSVGLSTNVFSFNNDPCSGQTSIKYGDQIYNTVVINGKCWLKENINIGIMVPGNQTLVDSVTIQKYCYNNDTANCSVYGGLYTRPHCPQYWQRGSISDIGEYFLLYDANSLKEIGQGSGFGSGTNSSGFSLLLGGYRWSDGTFQGMGQSVFSPNAMLNPGVNMGDAINGSSSHIGYSEAIPATEAGFARCYRVDAPLILQSPIGGETWQVGSNKKITWSHTNTLNISIDYSTDNGSNWINIINSLPTSDLSYNWTIPNTPSRNCKVRIIDVAYSDSTSISNNVFTIYPPSVDPCMGIASVDYSGQTYHTVAIGNLCWLKENMNIGIMIDSLKSQSNNGIIEKYCYNNDTNNCNKYGGLYYWYEAMQYDTSIDAQGICPSGWVIPSINEYIGILAAYVNNDAKAIKDVSAGGTNTSGFSALFAGYSYLNGSFMSLGWSTGMWSSSKATTTNYYSLMSLVSNEDGIIQYADPTNIGFSVRCMFDYLALPVELTSFSSTIINNTVKLNWATATEVNSFAFEIEKKLQTVSTWQMLASLNASGNSTSPKQYSYTDKNVISGKYNYRLKMVDLDGSFKYSNIISAEIRPPAKYELSNAYPNPWNPTTTIRYQLPINILVTIKVFDALGREVSTLVNEVKPAGNYELTFNGKGLASGIYYYQMKAGNFIETKKIILLK